MVLEDEIRRHIEQLKKASKMALDAEEYRQGVELANAAKTLQEWLERGGLGELPIDPAKLLQKGYTEASASLHVSEVRADYEAQRTATVHARLSGSGAIAQNHSVAAGAGGIAVAGDLIIQLREPLRSIRKDIRAVERARLKAQELLLSGEVADPVSRRQIEEIYRGLDQLRDEMLRASEGAASAERAQDFERAIEQYRSALREGYDVIVDDTTGEPIEVAKALERVLQAYWADLRERSSRRYNEASDALRDGYPETAVVLLEEAQELTNKVEEGGEEIRRQVAESLARAQEELRNKREAQRLVTEAQVLTDPVEARTRLLEAQQLYPRYCNLETVITETEKLVLALAEREAAADLSEARGALALAKFDLAREHCRTALRRGANLSNACGALAAHWQEAQSLLGEIGEHEAMHDGLVVLLTSVDESLETGNIPLARDLVAQLLAKRDDSNTT